MTTGFAERVRAGEPVLGYWLTLDAALATERLAGLGYDFLVVDGQHGLLGYDGMVAALLALDAGALRQAQGAGEAPAAEGRCVGLVRTESASPTAIGRALDAGAYGVVVPLVDSAEEAAAAVAAARYPPSGVRSFGPTRSGLRIGPAPRDADAATVVLAMVETPGGLARVEQIAATPGLDGIFVGPNDLRLALGAATPDDPAFDDAMADALARVRRACADAGVAAGIYTSSGEEAARRLAEGFTVVVVAFDLRHLEQAAAGHLAVARGTATSATARPAEGQPG